MESGHKYLQNAILIFNEFSQKPGSEHIATISSLTNILSLIKDNSFDNVVEIGSGIGTIAKLILENTTVRFYAYETNEWCINNLKLNTQYLRKFHIFDNFDFLVSKLNFNYFLIIDDYLNWKQVWRLMRNNNNPDCIFIEGYRNKQVGMFSFLLMVNSKKATFNRSTFHKVTFENKSGSYFDNIDSTSFLNALFSWVKRFKKTNEIYELALATYYLIRKTLKLRTRLKLITGKVFKTSN